MTRAAGTIARAAIILVIFNILSKLTALIREMVTARQFGATAETDAFFVAFTIPSVLFYLFTGALATVVVPVFSEYAAAGRERDAWKLFGTLFNVLLFLLGLGTVLGLAAAPLLVKIIAPGLSQSAADLAVQLTRIMFPLLIFSGFAALFSGLLNAKNIFAVTALNGPLSNIAVIAAIILLGGLWGVRGMALGVLVGGLAGALVQLPALKGTGFQIRPGVPLNHPDLKKILTLIIPITVGISVSEVYILIDRFLASGLVEGSISALNYALKLAQIPAGLFATAIGTAVFPSLTRLAAVNELSGLGEGVRKALRLVIAVCIPAAVILLVLREPLVTLFYFRGAFDLKAVQMTSVALFFYSFGVAGLAGEFVLVRGFYSLQDTRTPVIISITAVLVNLAFSLALIGPLKHGGLALANSIAALTGTTLLIIFLNRRVKGLWIPEMWRFLALVAAAAAAMGGAVQGLDSLAGSSAPGGVLSLAARLGLEAFAGLVVYVLLLTAFRLEETRQLWSAVGRGLCRFQTGGAK